jgi:hypothetical protein
VAPNIQNGKGKENRELGTGAFVHKRISAVKIIEYVSDKISDKNHKMTASMKKCKVCLINSLNTI